MSANPGVSDRQIPWGQVALITAAAILVFAGLRLLPTGTNLNHMDFRVENRGAGSIEFCDPLNPQFIPVVEIGRAHV